MLSISATIFMGQNKGSHPALVQYLLYKAQGFPGGHAGGAGVTLATATTGGISSKPYKMNSAFIHDPHLVFLPHSVPLSTGIETPKLKNPRNIPR